MKVTPNWPSIFRYSSCLSPGRWRWTSSTGQTLWKPFNFKLKDRVSTKLNIDQGTNFTTLRDTTASLVHFHRLTSRSSWSTKCWVKWLTCVKKKILTSKVHLPSGACEHSVCPQLEQGGRGGGWSRSFFQSRSLRQSQPLFWEFCFCLLGLLTLVSISMLRFTLLRVGLSAPE